MNTRSITIFCLILVFLEAGCTKFVQISPPATAITGSTVYSDNKSAAAAMTSIYVNMMTTGQLSGGPYSISSLQGYAADELTNYSNDPVTSQFYTNALTSASNGISNPYYWQELYSNIYLANAVLEGLNKSEGITDSIKQQLIGEAKFMRAFLNFYAVNLYGDIPLATTTNYLVNNSLHRLNQGDVYSQIVADLMDAQTKLSSHFVDYQGIQTSERTRPNKGAATALLARVYLYERKWDSAKFQSTALINNSQYSLGNDLSGVFLANSSEAIWQMQPVVSGFNTYDAPYFVLTSAPGTGTFNGAISSYLLHTFEPNDQRFSNWIGSFVDPSSSDTFYYPYKYKVYANPSPISEYLMVLRLAEQILIRAEAEAQLNDLAGAAADLNIIRQRAGLPQTTATTMPDLLVAIQHERRVELFTEWGHRWFDLKRNGQIDAVLGAPGNICKDKGGDWSSDWKVDPIPLGELQINRNLQQNPGY